MGEREGGRKRERKSAGERQEGKALVKEMGRDIGGERRDGGTGGIVEEEEGKEVERERALRVRVEGVELSKREEKDDSHKVDIRSRISEPDTTR